ncbi:MAG: IS5 family transposase [Planctomycetota bacterium]
MFERHKVAYRHPKYKTAYRVKNWPEYEKSLRNRGDITVWFGQDAIEAWTPRKNGKQGGQPLYSNIAIETSLSLRLVFRLPSRQTEGFLGSICTLMSLDLPCPDHTTLSRRNRTVDVQRNIDTLPDGPVCFIVDSTGLKICGQGEWHSRKYGEKRYKRWRKLHIGVNKDGWIMASKVTERFEQDPSQVPDLLNQVDREIECFVGDGVYDREPVYEAIQKHSPGTAMIVPPRKGAVLSNDSTRVLSQRNQHISKIERTGRANWRRRSGYYLQSHVENAIYRFKKIIGGRLRSKHGAVQEWEALIGCVILNRMLAIGGPISYPVR